MCVACPSFPVAWRVIGGESFVCVLGVYVMHGPTHKPTPQRRMPLAWSLRSSADLTDASEHTTEGKHSNPTGACPSSAGTPRTPRQCDAGGSEAVVRCGLGCGVQQWPLPKRPRHRRVGCASPRASILHRGAVSAKEGGRRLADFSSERAKASLWVPAGASFGRESERWVGLGCWPGPLRGPLGDRLIRCDRLIGGGGSRVCRLCRLVGLVGKRSVARSESS